MSPAANLGDALFSELGRGARRHVTAVAAAVLAHALAVGWALASTAASEPPLRALSVEFEPPVEPPPKLAPPAAEAPLRGAEPQPANRTPAARGRVPAATLAASRAAALVTATENAKPDDAALDFTHDPNAAVWGAGVVAIGGTAKVGARGAVAPVALRAPAASSGVGSDGLTAAADLSQKPRLTERDPCRGYFPAGAADDRAEVALGIVIAKSGKVTSANVALETPRGQGFGAAARACILGKRFTPALDRAGRVAATATRINVRFSR